MIDPTDWLDAPRSLLLGVLRVLWWLAWDFFVETIGWTIGWSVLRLLTLGRYPRCCIPDDCIDPRRYPLLAAREAMRQLVDDLLGRSILAPGDL